MKKFLKILLYTLFILSIQTNIIHAEPSKNPRPENLKPLLNLEENITNFKISANEQYIAYYNSSSRYLIVKNLYSNTEIWRKKTNTNLYDWHPSEDILIYSDNNKSNFSINTINIHNPASLKTIHSEKSENQDIIFLKSSPQKDEVFFIVLKGFANAHGYTSTINYVDQQKVSSIGDYPDSEYITFSTVNSNFAISQLNYLDMTTNTLKLIDANYNLLNTITEGHITSSPLFSLNGKEIVYSELDDNNQKIVLYDLEKNKSTILKNHSSDVQNLCWLNKDTLVYLSGTKPHIEIFNIITQNNFTLSEGMAPFTLNNNLYFLKENPHTYETLLYVYINN
ncbi:hypothetical protein SAMN00017405_1514 [Desulfonispora thiosulfatigenes DSM 11270]|uniref:WD40-like Beta Propeller Repeat n=1 Tax=Desulfonispora thiosulfatigenes DSM 11270 TaxID=656914 RepID=A0A1W1VSX5_DESTI|nr:hypothetical protein [Desulfonispora thiosulfatigenes]SMB96373.1 hypothetical protein SAMN00017405_1514 [Desulfonispora thiosulfatigenes DSM 11270]